LNPKTKEKNPTGVHQRPELRSKLRRIVSHAPRARQKERKKLFGTVWTV
jgi:hypothetical protein